MSPVVFVGAGKKAGIRPGDLVGAIAGESGVPSSAIGAIRIAENFSVVEVPEDSPTPSSRPSGPEHCAARR